jgi:hypothetical protein
MVQAEFNLPVLSLTTMNSIGASLSIPRLSATGPPLTPESMLTTELKSSWMMKAYLFVVSIRIKIFGASPISANHLAINLGMRTFTLLFLFNYYIRHIARMTMSNLERRGERY